MINAELSIIDTDFYVLAGTRKYRHLIGKKAIPYIYEVLFEKKETIVVENPKEDQACSKCFHKEKCSEYAGINTPLLINGKVIGALSISALNIEQKRVLIKCKKSYIAFSKKMIDLIQSKINSQILTNKLNFTTRQLDSIINYANEGIVFVNNDGEIEIINNYCCEMFDLKLEEVINRPLHTIFKNRFVSKMIYQGEKFDNLETNIRIMNNKFKIIHSGKSIDIEDDFKGYLWFLRDVKSINELVTRFTVSKEDITFKDIIGRSPELQHIKKRAYSVASSDSTILIQGESGTGKELFARAIHNSSQRKNKPFISINCGAIPENLIESELFGYEGGAFSGARAKGKPGKLELADSGTFFLDEVADMPLHLQVKLLRALEERKITRLGGIEEIKIDVRIIAASNKNLESMIIEKEFREDLFYRLNVIPLKIPSLRERGREDIKVLTGYFTRKYSKILNKDIEGVDEVAVDLLTEYYWPGNVRELENTIEYAINIDEDGFLNIDDLPKKFKERSDLKNRITPVEELIEIELRKAVNFYGDDMGGKKRTAEALGVGIATLYRWLNKYNLSN